MRNVYSPREFGRMVGRAVVTLQRWDRKGIFKANRTPTGRRYYTQEQYLQFVGQKVVPKKIASYCRVSSGGQRTDLLSQKKAVEQFCLATGRVVEEKMEEIGSGLSYKRKKFVRLLELVERGEIS